MVRSIARSTLAVVAVSSLLSAAAGAQGTAPSGMTMNGYQIETALVNSNFNTGDFTMPQEVKVLRSGSDARGDRAHGNSKRGFAILEGHVVIHDTGGAPEAKEAGADYSGPATITCDTLTLDLKARSYDAQGNVHFSQGNRTGSAQRGILNQTAHTLHLEGDVILTEGETSIRGKVVD